MFLFLLPLFASAQSDDVYGKPKTRKDILFENKLKDSLFNAGSSAAYQHYKGYKGAASGTLITTIISPILGLAPAIGTTSGVPDELMHPSYDFLKNPKYYDGYTTTAKRIRSKKVWNKYLLGFGINLAITGTIIAIVTSDKKVYSTGTATKAF